MKYQKQADGIYQVALEQGDELIKSLENLAAQENIASATIQGVGAVEKVTVGYFDLPSLTYSKKRFDGEYELLSANGNISISPEGKPFVHLHIAFSDENFLTYGGHLFEATTAVVGEFFIIPVEKIQREFNSNLNLNCWGLNSRAS